MQVPAQRNETESHFAIDRGFASGILIGFSTSEPSDEVFSHHNRPALLGGILATEISAFVADSVHFFGGSHFSFAPVSIMVF